MQRENGMLLNSDAIYLVWFFYGNNAIFQHKSSWVYIGVGMTLTWRQVGTFFYLSAEMVLSGALGGAGRASQQRRGKRFACHEHQLFDCDWRRWDFGTACLANCKAQKLSCTLPIPCVAARTPWGVVVPVTLKMTSVSFKEAAHIEHAFSGFGWRGLLVILWF